MTRYGVLKHDPNNNGISDFYRGQQELSIQQLFDAHKETARQWYQKRKSGLLKLNQATDDMVGGGVGCLEEFKFLFIGSKYNAPNNNNIAQNQCKAISEAQLGEILNLYPDDQNNPILNLVMAYSWSFMSIVKSARERGRTNQVGIGQVQQEISQLNKQFFEELKEEYLNKLKFETETNYQEFQGLVDRYGHDKEVLAEAFESLIKYNKNFITNQTNVESNTQRYKNIWGNNFSNAVLQENRFNFGHGNVGYGELYRNQNMEAFNNYVLDRIINEYIGDDTGKVDQNAYNLYENFVTEFYKTKNLPPINKIFQSLYQIQYMILDDFFYVRGVGGGEPDWFQNDAITRNLRATLSNDLINDSGEFLDAHFSLQSATELLVKASNSAIDEGKDITEFLPEALKESFTVVEITKRPRGSGSIFRSVNKEQRIFIEKLEEIEEERDQAIKEGRTVSDIDIVYDVGCGGGKSYILQVLEDAGYSLITLSWPLDDNKKEQIERRLTVLAQMPDKDKEIMVALDDTSKVSDSYHDKIKDNHADLIQKMYDLGLKPRFIHSSATAKLPNITNCESIAAEQAKDKNVQFFNKQDNWKSGRITKQDLTGGTVYDRFKESIINARPKDRNNHAVMYFPDLNEALIRESLLKYGKERDKNDGNANRDFVYFDDKVKDDRYIEYYNQAMKRMENLLFQEGGRLGDGGNIGYNTSDRILDLMAYSQGYNGWGDVPDQEKGKEKNRVLFDKLIQKYQDWIIIKNHPCGDGQEEKNIKARKILSARAKFEDALYESLPGKAFMMSIDERGNTRMEDDYSIIEEYCTHQDNLGKITYLIGSENYVGRNFPDNGKMRDFYVGILGDKLSCDLSVIGGQLPGRNRDEKFVRNRKLNMTFFTPSEMELYGTEDGIREVATQLDTAAEYRYYLKEHVKPFWRYLCDVDTKKKGYTDPNAEEYDKYLDFKKEIVSLCKDEQVNKLLASYLDGGDKNEIARKFFDKWIKDTNFASMGEYGDLSVGKKIINNADIQDFAIKMTNSAVMYALWHKVTIGNIDVSKIKDYAVEVTDNITNVRRKLITDLGLNKQDNPEYQSLRELETYRKAACKNDNLLVEKEYFRVLEILHSMQDDLLGGIVVSTDLQEKIAQWNNSFSTTNIDREIVSNILSEAKILHGKRENGGLENRLNVFNNKLENLLGLLGENVIERLNIIYTGIKILNDSNKVFDHIELQAPEIIVSSSAIDKVNRSMEQIAWLVGEINKEEGVQCVYDDNNKNYKIRFEDTFLFKRDSDIVASFIYGKFADIIDMNLESDVSSEISNDMDDDRGDLNKLKKKDDLVQQKDLSWYNREKEREQNRDLRSKEQIERENNEIKLLHDLEQKKINLELVKKVKGKIQDVPVLIVAIDKGCDPYEVKQLLNLDCVNPADTYKDKEGKEYNALHYAVAKYGEKTVKDILNSCPSLINVPDKQGFLPMDYARGNPQMISVLRSYGAKEVAPQEQEVVEQEVDKNKNHKVEFSTRNKMSGALALISGFVSVLLFAEVIVFGFAIPLAFLTMGISAVGIFGAIPSEQKIDKMTKEKTVVSETEKDNPQVKEVDLNTTYLKAQQNPNGHSRTLN